VKLGDDRGSHEHAVIVSEVLLSVIEAGLAREKLNHLPSQMIQIERAGGAQIRQERQPILDLHAMAIQLP